jgi:hypothetical protein
MKFIKFTIFLIFTGFIAYAVAFSNVDKGGLSTVKNIENLSSENADAKIRSITETVVQKSVEEQREELSLSTTAGEYQTNNCIDIKHTDGAPLKVCVSIIEGVANGLYNYNKSLIVVESLNIPTLVHELVHASTVHNSIQINDDITRITEPKFQERIAYDVEYMLTQVLDSQK